MILRKPYAFFIKYFKLIHLIMAFFMFPLILQTNSFLSFFNEYINSNMVIVGTGKSLDVFTKLTYVYIIIVLLMDVFVWILLEFKNKKRLLYIINFGGYALIMAFYVYVNSLLVSMDKQIVDVRLLMTIRDLVVISFTFQTLSFFIIISRFFGFDIKKFDFENDIKELELSISDNEEFEVNFEVDPYILKRKFSETLRNFKYYFKENIRIIVPVLIGAFILIIYTFYKNITGNTTVFKQNVEFSVPNYRIIVTDTLVTNKDYKMNLISKDTSLVILKVKLKTTNKTEQFVFGKFILQIGDNKYYHTINYSDSIYDIGETYIKQKLTNNYEEFLLVYEIPNSLKDSKKNLIYYNKIGSNIFDKDTITKVNLKSVDLDKNQTNKDINLNEIVTLDKSLNGVEKLNLKQVEISDLIKVKYNKCFSEDDCHIFYEPLQADFYGSYDKAILKIDLELTFDDDVKNKSVVDYIKYFGTINYKKDGVDKNYYLTKQIIPSKVKSKLYYFEIPKEILTADDINVSFFTRGVNFIYSLK